MALTAIVTKQSVTLKSARCWQIAVGLELKEGVDTVLQRTFVAIYKQGQTVSLIEADLQAAMQDVIDQYRGEQDLLGKVALDTVITNLTTNLDTTG